MGSAMVEQDSATQVEGTPGDVRAFDVRTGKPRWTFHVVPPRGRPGAEDMEGRPRGAYTGAGNVWALMSADDELG